ncbi:uncharacterized protein LACBIDRAFT_334343 [Laccaria bicolor S238N-H82]|uniref:Predicted protein n=1 Tax=Laccaria bicolor (strain S238N-H82 / ATCC MYA-4686) TaxID=486041 RepID=B0DYX0_LACBS|nr:uncharacterized protein LACBIDRAFT_334343 [Laccaria bicolor S238N-H82]EDR00240.1 predicted protein [Laccaria bicolor S238N-H82]|eukprot:XP_001889149.1 predicted protein [Laccaria bicolor S238N-H82]
MTSIMNSFRPQEPYMGWIYMCGLDTNRISTGCYPFRMSLSCHLFLSGASRTALILANSLDRVGPRQEECATWLASPYTAILLIQEGAQAATETWLPYLKELRTAETNRFPTNRRQQAAGGGAGLHTLEAVAASDDAFPPLKLAVVKALDIIDIIKKFNSNRRAWAACSDNLTGKFEEIIQYTSQFHKHHVPSALQSWLEDLKGVSDIHQQSLRKFPSFTQDTEHIEKFEGKVNEIMSSFHVLLWHGENFQTDSTQTAEQLRTKEASQDSATAAQVTVFAGAQDIQMNHSVIIAGQIVHYNNTEELQDKINAMIEESKENIKAWVNDLSMPNILWLSGSPGSGKTTIASTVVASFEHLSGQFFFHRDQTEFQNPDNLWRCLALDLAQGNTALKISIAQALEAQKAKVRGLDIPMQFEHLIVRPLQEASQSSVKPLLLVIDALDECDSYERLLPSLKSCSQLSKSLKLLVTSRRYPDIQNALKPVGYHIDLHAGDEVSDQTADDLWKYFTTRFLEGANLDTSALYLNWPGLEKISFLVEKAAGLFIWAKSAMDFILYKGGDIQGRLEVIYSNTGEGTDAIDGLYHHIISAAFQGLRETEKNCLSSVLGSIVIARNPLRSSDLEQLLEVQDALSVISQLSPVLSISESGHLQICHQKNVKSTALDHASYFWAIYLQKCSDRALEEKIMVEMEKFLINHLLHWLEIMSLMGAVNHAAHLLLLAETWCKALKPIAYSSNGKHIISGSSDKTIKIWDALTGQCVMGPLEGHDDWITSVVCSPDGGHIVSGSKDMTIRVWNTLTGQSVMEPLKGHSQCLMDPLIGHDGGVQCLAYSPDGMNIVSGSFDFTIRVWDALSGQSIMVIFRGSALIHKVAFSPDGKHILCATGNHIIRLWNALTSHCTLSPLKNDEGSVNSVVFSPNGKHILSGCLNIMGPLKGHDKMVTSVAFSPDGRYIASGSHDCTVRVWDALTGQSAMDPLKGHDKGVISVAFSPDGRYIASGSSDMTVRVWNALTGQSHEYGVHSVAFSPDGRYIVSGSDDKTVRVWDSSTGQSVMDPLKGHYAWVYSVAFSPDGKYIVSGSLDKTIRLWDAVTGHSLGDPFQGHYAAVLSVVFSPDDKTIRLWDCISHFQE